MRMGWDCIGAVRQMGWAFFQRSCNLALFCGLRADDQTTVNIANWSYIVCIEMILRIDGPCYDA